jgi:periplasmic copper chaperone A
VLVLKNLASLVAWMLVFAAAFGPAFAAEPVAPLAVENAWIRMPAPGLDTAAVYLSLKNPSKRQVFVVGVTTKLAEHAMIHETSIVEGQSRMRMRENVVVAPGKTVAFAPEGLHIMLTGLKKALAVGEKVPLTLELDHGGSVDVVATVRPLDAK